MKLLPALALLAASAAPVFSATPAETRITHAVREVRCDPPATSNRAAAAHAVIANGTTLRTGARSRAEVTFGDLTVSRLGAESEMTVENGARNLRLHRGTLLLDIPRLHHKARVRIGALTASGSGTTVLIAHAPGDSVKVLVLAGTLRLTVAGWIGDSIALTPGKMLMAKPDVRTLPAPVDVDTLVKTSSLIATARFFGSGTGAVAPLPGLPQITRTIARQTALLEKRTLLTTNLAIRGNGTSVTILGKESAAAAKPKVATRGNRAVRPGGEATAQTASRPSVAARE
jgi:hypothetical protein